MSYQVITEVDQETDKADKSQDHSLLFGTETAGLCGGDAPADGRDLSEAEQHSAGSARENTEPLRYFLFLVRSLVHREAVRTLGKPLLWQWMGLL